MRVFIATGIFHPEPGGPTSYLYRFIPELIDAGHDVTVLTYGDGPTDTYPYPVTRIPRTSPLGARFAYRQAAQRLWSNHDLAYVHSLGLPLPAKIRPRVIKIVGDPAWERAVNKGWIPPTSDIDAFQTEKQKTHVEVNKWLRAHDARNYQQVIVPSNYLKEIVQGWGVPKDNINVIYNAVPGPGITPDMTQKEAREALGLTNFPTIFAPARLTGWKGIDHVMRAMVRSGLHILRLVVAGDGPMREELETLSKRLSLSRQVTFVGRVPLHDMPVYYRAADFTVVYSGYEGLSQTILESLRAGTPVIASFKGGNPEIVKHGINGLLAPYVDVDGLGAALAEAFTTPGKKAELASNTHYNLEKFRWASLVEQTLSVLEKVNAAT